MVNIPQKKFSAEVVRVENVAQGVRKISFKVSQSFLFLPWQYVWIEIVDMKIADPKGSRRAFSIFNTINNENIIEIVARIGNSGYKQNLFALNVGDNVIVHGPFGNSFVIKDDHQPESIVMIAGGVGIAAFMPLIHTIRAKKYKSRCFLVYLNRNEAETPFLKELKDFKKDNNFFDFKNKYEYFSWDDVKDLVGKVNGKIEWWITGPQAMVNHVFAELEKGGVSRPDMSFGNFYPSSRTALTKEMVDLQITENNLFAKAIQNSTNHTVITDSEGTVIYANKAAERITGYTNEEIIGNNPRLWGGMMSHEFYIDFWKKKKSGEPFMGEIVNRRKNGEIYYAIAHIAPIFGKEHELIGYIGTEEDITVLKKAEEEIISNATELSNFFDLSDDLIGVANTNGYWMRVNPAFTKLLGFQREELLKNPFMNFIHPDDAKATANEVAKLSSGIRTVNFINRHRKSDGSYATVQWNASPHGTDLYVTGRDVTIAKEKEGYLERLNKVMVDRELKMIEMKKELQKLKNSKE